VRAAPQRRHRLELTKEEDPMAAPASVDAYIAALSDDVRPTMEQLRATVCAAAPRAVEAIAYGMPALRGPGGRFLVSYDAYRHHYSLFPASGAVVEALGDQIKPYVAGSATIQFPKDAPIPLDLVRRVVEVRLQELEARA
jgi:uncharacterized protein YdhG (YjbR/CyaY superfamily)